MQAEIPAPDASQALVNIFLRPVNPSDLLSVQGRCYYKGHEQDPEFGWRMHWLYRLLCFSKPEGLKLGFISAKATFGQIIHIKMTDLWKDFMFRRSLVALYDWAFNL